MIIFPSLLGEEIQRLWEAIPPNGQPKGFSAASSVVGEAKGAEPKGAEMSGRLAYLAQHPRERLCLVSSQHGGWIRNKHISQHSHWPCDIRETTVASHLLFEPFQGDL